MLILLGAFAALTDWFSFWEMIIDEPSQYTIPLLCKRLLLASASVSTALLVLKWCLEYVQMNATLVQRKKGQSGDIELGERSRLIDSGVDSQAATPRGPSATAPIIARFHRPDPPRWLVRMITVLSGISVLNDIIDFINVVIILCAIGNPRSHAMGILISNLSLNLLNAIASVYKAMRFEASRERMQQLAIARRPEDPGVLGAAVVLFAVLGVIGALCAYWGWSTWWISWIGGFLWWLAIAVMLMISMCGTIATCSREPPSGARLFDYSRLGLLHVLIAELVYTTSTWITFLTIAMFNKRVPIWLWRLYCLIPATETLILYPSLIATLEQKIDARAHRHPTKDGCSILCEALFGLTCNVLFLCYPTYQLQLLPIANIILTVAVFSCQLSRRPIGLQHAELIDRIHQIRKEDAAWISMAMKQLLDGGADPNMACGEPLHQAVMAETETDDSDSPLVRDTEGAPIRIFNTVELLLEAGADPNLGKRRFGGLVVAPLDEVVIQPELKDVAVLLKANGARHSDDYYKYGGHINQARYAALLMRSNALDCEEYRGICIPWRREKDLEADLKTLAEAVCAETAEGRVFVPQGSSNQGSRRLLQVFLRENTMLILLGAFAALTDWFSFWEMIIDEPSQYTIPLLCKRLLLASASVSTALLVLKWCLEYVQMNATLVQRKKGQSGDIELGERSRLIDSGVDSQAATPRGPSPTAPIITRFDRPHPPRWLIRVITVLSGISVLNDSIDFINVVIILCAIGNPRSHAMGILISNLSLNLLNAIASAYKAMGFEASRERMQQLAQIIPGVSSTLILYPSLILTLEEKIDARTHRDTAKALRLCTMGLEGLLGLICNALFLCYPTYQLQLLPIANIILTVAVVSCQLIQIFVQNQKAELEDEEKAALEADLKTLAEAVPAESADGQVFESQGSSSQGSRRVLQVFLRENTMLILLGAFAALTDWFSFWEMNIDEPSQYTIPLLCKRLFLASASVSTGLLVLKWCLEYVQMNATLVQRKKPPSGDIELGGRSRLIDSHVDSQAATPRGPSPTAPIITRFHRPPPPRWLVRMITVLSGISVLNDIIDSINVVIILCAIGNPRNHAMGILISNLSLNLLNAIASAYKAMGFEASRERIQQLTRIMLSTLMGGLVVTHCLIPKELLSDVLLSDYHRLGLLHVLTAELVYTTSTWITFFTTAVFGERVPTWLWHLYFLCPATATLILYPSLILTLEEKIDARTHRDAAKALRLCTMGLEGLLGLICNVLFLCYPTYQLQLLPIANIILTVAVISCQLITEITGLHHAELIDRIDQIRKGDTGWKSMGESIALYFYPEWGYRKADALAAVKMVLDGGADPNMACGEPLYRAVMAETATDGSDSPLVRDAEAVATRIFNTVELLLEAGADPNLGTRQLAGGLIVAPLDEVVIQPELKDVAVFLKANGARHSDDYYKYGGHTNQARYAALLMRSKELIGKFDAWRQDFRKY
ncbi:unnamed protein product [Vitrella brassicaformis CCMP3155]|uniref:Uncharacterized protein n=1 Tax=Vitrella brassicaformis (strain CCMP3155) TaxID=1169540 RepID=A0A0G4EPT0_VITBC|nr:unnamed protein product [Vitrella brassicaformis CCMP3155]|eukprot:CEL99446.1 unnamed protein product [Vitrella brassicaformis CCMP3155]